MQHTLQKFPPLHVCEPTNSAHPWAFDGNTVCWAASLQASAVAPDQMSQSAVRNLGCTVTPLPPYTGRQEQGYVLHSRSGRILCRFLQGFLIAPILRGRTGINGRHNLINAHTISNLNSCQRKRSGLLLSPVFFFLCVCVFFPFRKVV